MNKGIFGSWDDYSDKKSNFFYFLQIVIGIALTVASLIVAYSAFLGNGSPFGEDKGLTVTSLVFITISSIGVFLVYLGMTCHVEKPVRVGRGFVVLPYLVIFILRIIYLFKYDVASNVFAGGLLYFNYYFVATMSFL